MSGKVATKERDTLAFHCPNCGATVTYDAESEMLDCQYCDSQHEISTLEEQDGVRELDLDELFGAHNKKSLPATRVLACDNCGANTTVSGQKTTARCSFCASEMVSEIEPEEQLVPSALIPFQIPRRRASKMFSRWLTSLWFRPNDLQKMARVATLEGVYAPFWTFDAHADSRWKAESGEYYYEKESYRDENGKTRTRRVRKTRWKWVRGSREADYDDVLICASKGLDAGLISQLEPYHTKRELKPYQAEFLAGWSAEQYAIPPEKGWALANKEIEQREYKASRGEVPGDTQRFLSVSTSLSQGQGKHVLLPVWIAAYHYDDKTYRFLVNGETGKVSGEAPYSWIKIFFFVVAVILALFSVLASGGLMLIPIGMGVIAYWAYLVYRERKLTAAQAQEPT